MLNADWIRPSIDLGEVCPSFQKIFTVGNEVEKVALKISARGVYTAEINGRRIDDFVLAPGWTMYDSRIQFQEYDITDMLSEKNELVVTVAKGWYLGRISRVIADDYVKFPQRECGIIAELSIEFTDGTTMQISTDETWMVGESAIRFCDIYDGEIYDATHKTEFTIPACRVANNDRSVLIPQ